MLDIELRLFCKTSVDKPTLQFRKQTDLGPDYALCPVRSWSAWQDVPIEVAAEKTPVWTPSPEQFGNGVNQRDYVANTTDTNESTSLYAHLPVATGYVLSDADIDGVFNSMPDGPQGFCKTWGYRHFAKKLMALIAERLVK